MKEKILEKISEELFLALLKVKGEKVCSINTLLLFNESLKMIDMIENSKKDTRTEGLDFICNGMNNINDENFDKIFGIYNRLVWIKENYVNAWH